MGVKLSELLKIQGRRPKAAIFLVRLLIAMAASAAAGLICLIYTNFGVLKNIGFNGTFDAISEGRAFIITDDAASADIVFKDSSGVYINKLIFDVDSAGEPSNVSFKISVRTKGYGGKGTLTNKPQSVGADNEGYYTYLYTDNNPIYVRTEVIDLGLKNVSGIHIEMEGSESRASGFSIDNTLNKNTKAVSIVSLLALALAAVILWKDFFVRKPEFLFLIAALSVGTCMISGLPKTKLSYDEETHMQAVLAIANYPDTSVHMSRDGLYQVIVTEYNNPKALPDGNMEVREYEDVLDERCFYNVGSTTPTFSVPIGRIPAYLTMAASAKISGNAGLPWTGMIVSVRLANLLTYTLLMFFAIKLVPFGKALMVLIGLFPQMTFMASTCSYDPFIVGSISLGYAFMLKGRKYIIPMILCFAIGCLPKAVYAPVLLLGMFMLSSLGSGYGSEIREENTYNKGSWKKHDLIIAMICGSVFIAIIAAFILPTVITPSDSGDIRGGEAVSEMGQIGFILSQPFTYAGILIRQMIRNLGRCWFGADCMTYMAHLVNGETSFKGYYVPCMLILAMIILSSHADNISGFFKKNAGIKAMNGIDGLKADDGCEADDGCKADDGCEKDGIPSLHVKTYGQRYEHVRLTAVNRAWSFLMVMFSSVLIWTAMYVAFTEPGSREIAGVQGRYFIPLMFPLYLALCGNLEREACLWQTDSYGINNVLSQMSLTYITGLAELMILAATVWKTVILPFCV